MCPDDCHDYLIDLVIILKSDKDITQFIVLHERIRDAILIISDIRIDRRYGDPYLEIHLLCEFLELDDIILICDGKLVTIEEDAVSLERSLADKRLER